MLFEEVAYCFYKLILNFSWLQLHSYINFILFGLGTAVEP